MPITKTHRQGLVRFQSAALPLAPAAWRLSAAICRHRSDPSHLDFSVPSVTVTPVWIRSIFYGCELA